MTILWIIALFLVVPTYGISIIIAVILSFIIIKNNHKEYAEMQMLESYTRRYAIYVILERNKISTKLSTDFLYEMYGSISTEINTRLKYLPLQKRTEIIIMVFTKIVSECNDNVYEAIIIEDRIMSDIIDQYYQQNEFLRSLR